MAITNAQQFKQLVNPPMKGKKRPGYRGDDAYGGGDSVAGGGDQGNVGGDRDSREIGARMSRTQAMARANQKALAALGDPDPNIDKSLKDRDTITSFGKNLFYNVKANPFSLFSPTMTALKTAYQTGKARDLLGLTTTNDDDDDTSTEGDGDNFRETMIAQQFSPYQQDLVEDKIEELGPIELAIQQRDLLGGPRAFVAEGGIMDLEQARQGYKLGKLVKKVTRGLKKIVKSPIGAAAVASFLPIFKTGTTSLGVPDRESLFKKFDLGNKFINLFPSDNKDRFALAAAAGLTAAPFLLSEDDTEDEYQKFLASRGASGQGLDIQGIRNDPYNILGRAFVAEGGKPEPVAKKTMPLLDMGGKEMDLRAEGGFVPIGRMEKADDVPARLSKNEFVFTADAVRNAGDGDVDKGAEVMYNMMKNLESGGDVSEESQGLEGARKMFQTSQRLEEVL